MQLIDANGKFFGTFNLFDLVVFLLIVLTVITAGKLLFFNETLKILVSKPMPWPVCPKTEIPNLNMTYTNDTVTLMKNQPFWELNALPVKHNRFDGGLNFELLNKRQITENAAENDFELKFRLQALKKWQSLVYKDTILKIGKILSLQTPYIDINSIILTIDVNE